MEPKTDKSIAVVLQEFLDAQEKRLSARTFAQYESIVDLFQSYLQSYWPGHDGQYSEEPGQTYCERFGPEEIVPAFGEFLGYFLPRKVMCGQETARAAVTVTTKLAAWLAEQGYVKAPPKAPKPARSKGRGLANCKKAERILDALVQHVPPVSESSLIQDHFWVERVEPGKLWLQPLLEGNEVIGPVAVPEEATACLEEGCDIGGAVGKYRGKWHLIEVWNISPAH